MAEATGSAADGLIGLVNVFVDPQTTAQKVPSRLSWLWPVLVLVIGYTVITYLMMPYSMQMMEASIRQRNLPPEQLDQALAMGRTIGQGIAYATPIIGIGFTALFALLIKVVYSMMDVRPKFRDVFSMLAACSVIPLLQMAATYVVLRTKGDPVETPEQLQPSFGLDIFLQGIHGATFAFVHFFSIFQIWYLVVLVFGLAYLTKSTRMQALFAITPVWLIPLALAMIGGMFQKSPA
jgi:hypothetical protein